jgi:hypothetical protein
VHRGRAQGLPHGRRKIGRSGRRRRLKGAPGRGTLEKEKPPVFRRTPRGGQVVIRMLAEVNQKRIAPETAVFSNEFDSYARLP